MSAACPPQLSAAQKQRVVFALSYSYRWIAKTATPGGHDDDQPDPICPGRRAPRARVLFP